MFTISCLPKKFISCSKSLQQLGINNVAWNYHDVLNVIEYLVEHGYVILGGDVYNINGDILESTYDSWHTDDASLDNQNLIAVAQARTIEYINNYHLRNGDQYLYSLVFEKQLQD